MRAPIFLMVTIGFAALVFGVLFWPGAKQAPYRIGVLHPTKVDVTTFNGFKERLAELGYVDGEHVAFVYNGPAGRGPKLAEEAKRLVEAKVDLIFASSTPATQAAKKATEGHGIAVVFGPVNDPIAAAVVSSLQRPGGNVTGVKLPSSGAKRLEWLTKVHHTTKAVVVPYNPADKSSTVSAEMARKAADLLGIEVIAKPVHNPTELDSLLGNLPDRVNAMFLPRDAMITNRLPAISKAAIANRVALSVPGLNQVNNGGFVSYGFAHHEVGRRAAELADKIIGGSAPGDIPVAIAKSFLAINLKTAAQIGVKVPEAYLKQARTIVR